MSACPRCERRILLAKTTEGKPVLLDVDRRVFQLKDSVLEPAADALGPEVYSEHDCEGER